MNEIVDRLSHISNVLAIVLGGSHASGMAGPDSDLDLGVYYREGAPFAIEQVRAVLASVALPGSQLTVTDFYGWGRWVNGGAWIQTANGEVDLIYRNLDQVERVSEEGNRGIWQHDFDQQPPYGFRSVVYFGETHIAKPLYDPNREIARLKQRVAQYPKALRDTIIQECLWGAEFSLWWCRTPANGGDVLNAAGGMTRVSCARAVCSERTVFCQR